MPSSRAARNTRSAISPRLATSTFCTRRTLASEPQDADQRQSAYGGEQQVDERVARHLRECAAARGAERLSRRPGDVHERERVAVVEAAVLGALAEHGHAGREERPERPAA